MASESHEEPLQITEADGLHLPEEYIGYEGGLVVRTPRGGTKVLTPREFSGLLDSIKPRHFGEIDRLSKNGHLAPDYVQLKKYGEDEEVYRVKLNGGESP